MSNYHSREDLTRTINEVVLENVKFEFEQEFNPEQVQKWIFENQGRNGFAGIPVIGGTVFRNYVLRVKGELLAEVKKEEAKVHTENPATWWDHFKLQHFPASWLRRWPVKMKHEDIVVTFSRRFIFPDAYEAGNQFKSFTINDDDPHIKRTTRVVITPNR